MPTWVRWTRSKWHKPNEAFSKSLCGQSLDRPEYFTKETYGTPVDEHAVCMHCWRSNEIRLRKEEPKP